MLEDNGIGIETIVNIETARLLIASHYSLKKYKLLLPVKNDFVFLQT